MDIFGWQMAWHMGHPLSQTLFTSIYLDKLLWPTPRNYDDAHFGRGESVDEKNLPELVHLVLRAYCLGLIKCCDLVHARVVSEFYYEVSQWARIGSQICDSDFCYALRRKRTSAVSSITAHCYRI